MAVEKTVKINVDTGATSSSIEIVDLSFNGGTSVNDYTEILVDVNPVVVWLS